MKIGKFLLAFIFAFFFMTGNCFARGINDPVLFEDMRENPQNYIHIGGAGTGTSVWVCKKTLDVQEYKPPKYIIAINWAVRCWHDDNERTAHYWGPHRYLFDYDKREIYVEETDNNGNNSWKYLDPKEANGSNISRSKDIAAAEFAFYWEYNQCFFGHPLSNSLKNYIETGRVDFDDR